VAEFGLPKPYAMIGHSMGGGIGLRSLLNGLPVEKAMFSAPMWGILVTPAAKRIVGNWIAIVAPLIGQGERFVPTGTEDNYVETQPFAGNLLTNDAADYAIMQSHLRQHPEMSLGAPSLRWYNRALRECAEINRHAPAPHDCLCFLGGAEAIVDPAAVISVMAKWPNGKLVQIPAAQHEVLMEEPHVIKQVWDEIDAHLGV
jgi:lysophospholipase